MIEVYVRGVFMIKGIHHSEITVKDLNKSVEFYQKTLGLTLAGKIEQHVTQEGGLQGAKMKIALLQVGEGTLELIQYLNPKGKEAGLNPWDGGAQHVAFEVVDIRKMYDDLKEKGVNFLSPPIDYKEKDIDATWTYFKDPDGGLIELLEFH